MADEPQVSNQYIEPLPADDHEMWQHAEKYSPENLTITCQSHFFKRVTSREAQCQDCHWGLYLKGNEKVENGHIYDGETEII